MKVLILSPYPKEIIKAMKKTNDEYITFTDKITISLLKDNNIDFIVSYGYKFLINSRIIKLYKNKIINLHISFLPFNRGAYPNLWSHLEGTPAGVSIHQIDNGIDTGDILIQKKLSFDYKIETFKTTYEILNKEITNLFNANWELIKKNKIASFKQIEKGSYKSKSQGSLVLELLEKGWDTKIINAINTYKNFIKKKESDI